MKSWIATMVGYLWNLSIGEDHKRWVNLSLFFWVCTTNFCLFQNRHIWWVCAPWIPITTFIENSRLAYGFPIYSINLAIIPHDVAASRTIWTPLKILFSPNFVDDKLLIFQFLKYDKVLIFHNYQNYLNVLNLSFIMLMRDFKNHNLIIPLNLVQLSLNNLNY